MPQTRNWHSIMDYEITVFAMMTRLNNTDRRIVISNLLLSLIFVSTKDRNVLDWLKYTLYFIKFPDWSVGFDRTKKKYYHRDRTIIIREDRNARVCMIERTDSFDGLNRVRSERQLLTDKLMNNRMRRRAPDDPINRYQILDKYMYIAQHWAAYYVWKLFNKSNFMRDMTSNTLLAHRGKLGFCDNSSSNSSSIVYCILQHNATLINTRWVALYQFREVLRLWEQLILDYRTFRLFVQIELFQYQEFCIQ